MPDMEDMEMPELETTGGGIGGDSGGDGAPDDSGGTDSGGATGGGGSATVDGLEGYWFTGDGTASTDSTLTFTSGDVMFIENTELEGDICYGTATDGALTFDSCSMYGDVEWSAMSATLEVSGSTLVVSWDDGTVQEYTNTY
ncbi:hypothetical protein ACTWP5_01275 [Streptomyces sp. 4N509B]|uniref:hypothetical protein n=1 Tax=Streptomyces sp. 4N509B TaxID=3457413 RepID=UPI003FD181A1